MVRISTKPKWKRFVGVHLFFFHLVCLHCYVFSSRPTQSIFHTPIAQCSLFVQKVPLNSNKPTKPAVKMGH